MNDRARYGQSRWSVVLLVLVIGLVALTALRNWPVLGVPIEQGGGSPTATFGPTSTPHFPRPIYSQEEAIARSLEMFGGEATASVARLITHRTLKQWLHGPDYWAVHGPWSPGEFHPDHPAWLVGLLSDEATDADVLSIAIPSPFAGGTPYSVAGAFYAWDANGGSVAAFGVLNDEQEYRSIVLMPTEEVTVVPATEAPPIGWPTSTP